MLLIKSAKLSKHPRTEIRMSLRHAKEHQVGQEASFVQGEVDGVIEDVFMKK